MDDKTYAEIRELSIIEKSEHIAKVEESIARSVKEGNYAKVEKLERFWFRAVSALEVFKAETK